MGLPKWARAAYTPTRLFSTSTTVILYLAWLFGLLGLILWNFFTQAKQRQCNSYSSAEWIREDCEPAQLQFAGTYYTRPVVNTVAGEVGTIGIFPWNPLGFGNDSNGEIDYSILSLNWTSQALQCVMYEQSITIHLDTESTTTSTCYYCGTDLRIICTTLDSERTQISISSQIAIQDLLLQYNSVSVEAHAIASSFLQNSTVLSVKMLHHNTIDGAPSGVIPYTDSTTQVILGTTTGAFPIYDDNSDARVAQLARDANTLSSSLEIVSSRDLMPDVGDDTTSKRTLLVNYLCRQCKKVYKPPLEVISIIIASVSAVLAPAFVLMKLLAEKLTVKDQPEENEEDEEKKSEKIPLGSSSRFSKSDSITSPTPSPNGPYETYNGYVETSRK